MVGGRGKTRPPPAGLQKKIKPGAGGALVLFLVNVNGAFFEERSPLPIRAFRGSAGS